MKPARPSAELRRRAGNGALALCAFCLVLAGPARAQTPVAESTCAALPVPQMIAQIYEASSGSPDQSPPEQIRLEDFSGDGQADLLVVARFRTGGGSGDGAVVTLRMGSAQGICDEPLDMVLDAGAGKITVDAVPNPDGPPDFAILYQRNQRDEGAGGISETTRPVTSRFAYDPASFGYALLPEEGG